MAGLFAVERGSGVKPVVLLHGFGGSHLAWDAVVERIGAARRTLAFDLPGHAASLDHPHGSAAAAARAVLADLERRGIAHTHLVGHSMGGAAAALAAMMAPERAASLTLLAPGGFGPEINHRLLRRYAAATAEPELALLLEQFFGWEGSVPRGLAAAQAEERRAPGAAAALQRIVETFFEGNRQKVIDIAGLARLAVPVKVIWGTQDRVLPTRQAHRLPGRIAVHIFEATGHMLPQEIPREAAELVLENTR
jgi:pyruvate dehydrogenase E2 component (dihydrolipoamide acetyltransferase)